VPVSYFLLFFVFQKCYTGNILRIGQNKSQTSKYFTELPEDRRGDRAKPEGGHTIGRCSLGLARAPGGVGPLVHLWRYPFAYKDPPDGKNLKTRSLFQNTSRSAAVVDPRSGGSRSSSRHPAGEGNRHQRSSSSPCLPPARWVSSLPWTMGP
jgi:hypothetical protein